MLTYINIKNFAIIKELELDLQPQLTVLTGETGAGKSIIIDTLELALGGRADASLINNNSERCEITLIFDITDLPYVRNLLIKQELDSDNECIVRRIITPDGRSKSSINNHPCTQQTLREISNLLLDIHGQHEHQALLNTERQRELLDAFADNKILAGEVKDIYNSWLKSKKYLIELEQSDDDSVSRIDFIQYQIQELADLDCDAQTIEQLHLEQKKYNNIEQIAQNLNIALSIIDENEEIAVIKELTTAKNKLEKFSCLDPNIANITELLQNAIIQVQEAATSIGHHLNTIELNEARQQEVERQLTKIYDLARKHQVPPQDLPQIYLDLEKALQDLHDIGTKLHEAQLAEQKLQEEYLIKAKELSINRLQAIPKLDELITQKMQVLNMLGGKFCVNLIPNPNQNFSAHGLEKIEFLVSTNPGQALQPLNKIVSGGELSRISLAINVITATKEVTPTLVFDEVDSGIGGKTADIVGHLMRELAQKTQVICITHLPQVACYGNTHIVIEKITKPNEAQVILTTLSQNERINEIARMLGGVKITEQTLAHAKEMLNAVI